MPFAELPDNVLSNIISYSLGEPEYIKLKHSRGLRQIQHKFKPHYTKPKVIQDKPRNSKSQIRILTEYIISGKTMKPNIIKAQTNQIDKLARKQIRKNHLTYNINDYFLRLVVRVRYNIVNQLVNHNIYTNLVNDYISKQTKNSDINIATLLEGIYEKVIADFQRYNNPHRQYQIKAVEIKIEMIMMSWKQEIVL